MKTRTHDLVLGAAFLLAFPAAINLTDLTCSEPGAPGESSVQQAGLASSSTQR